MVVPRDYDDPVNRQGLVSYYRPTNAAAQLLERLNLSAHVSHVTVEW